MTDAGPPTPSANLPQTAICLHCGYSLRGLAEPICPECGRHFDPRDPDSYWDTTRTRLMRLIWRRWAKPPPLWHNLLAMLTLLAAYECAQWSGVFGPDDWLVAPLCILPMAIGLTLSQMIRRRAMRRCWWSRWNSPDQLTRRVRLRWMILPVCWLVGIVSVLAHPLLPPLEFPFLEWKAREVRGSGATQTGLRMIGLLPVRRIHPMWDGSVKFELSPGRAIRYYPIGTPLPESPGPRPPFHRFRIMQW